MRRGELGRGNDKIITSEKCKTGDDREDRIVLFHITLP